MVHNFIFVVSLLVSSVSFASAVDDIKLGTNILQSIKSESNKAYNLFIEQEQPWSSYFHKIEGRQVEVELGAFNFIKDYHIKFAQQLELFVEQKNALEDLVFEITEKHLECFANAELKSIFDKLSYNITEYQYYQSEYFNLVFDKTSEIYSHLSSLEGSIATVESGFYKQNFTPIFEQHRRLKKTSHEINTHDLKQLNSVLSKITNYDQCKK